MEDYLKCLLEVTGDTALLNTFDKAFRSSSGPQWADIEGPAKARYSLHALWPVPEAVRRRGYEAAGRLWCSDYWDTQADLKDVQVIRALGIRRYAFSSLGSPPKNAFRVISHQYPELDFCLTCADSKKGELQQHKYRNGAYQGSFYPHATDRFSEEERKMGFANGE